ncbi:unnamed protein product, partial [Lymnaea stagnalis]
MDNSSRLIVDVHGAVVKHTSEGLLTHDTRRIFEIINYVFLCSAIGLFGIVANIINIVVFYKQGLNNTVNITLTGLAVSDLCGLIILLWFDICVSPLFEYLNVPVAPSEFQHLTGGWPRGCFSRVANWITVFITAERCLCITAPLKVKKIITPRRTTIALFVMLVITILPLIPEYLTAYLDWKFSEERNRTVLGLVFTAKRSEVEGLTFLIYFIYIFVAYFPLIFLTAFLSYKLKQKTKWRMASTSDAKQSETISSRDSKTINMVVAIAIVFIVFNAPSVILKLTGYVLPGFGVIGVYTNYFFVTWSFAYLFESISSSVDILFYYRMSSKYRKTFHEVF